MFKFNFSDLEIEDGEDRDGVINAGETGSDSATRTRTASDIQNADAEVQARELSIDELSQALPPAFSFSPLAVPLSLSSSSSSSFTPSDDFFTPKLTTRGRGRRSVTLLRRDLFDARYQVISESDTGTSTESVKSTSKTSPTPTPASQGEYESPASVSVSASVTKTRTRTETKTDDTLTFIDNPSDLVAGVYEGGLKTWECSLDLVDCLAGFIAGTGRNNEEESTGDCINIRGKRIIESGCGTAIPSLFLLHTLFSTAQPREASVRPRQTEFVLQDYNDLVLKLVTFPNVLLTWYVSPLAEPYRTRHPPTDEDGDQARPFDPTSPGDLQITPELLAAFRSSLEEQHISIRFVAGSWQSLATSNNSLLSFPFDITLTSETIYQTSSLPSLIDLLKRCSSSQIEVDPDLALRAQELSIHETSRATQKDKEGRQHLCLVAAKVLYFGVGGGVMEFERAIREASGTVSTVLERKTGVGRRVMRVEWT